ncbi:esterase/lipase [Microdochium bolleyi]|uniref:Carboxylic ester hydrolase n=1 Tax=Microdochium bolleyi TaxID=196109 RepID=A0A136ISB8_9PEZI|nr:esterase/lipase [Microdochium bolleyi]
MPGTVVLEHPQLGRLIGRDGAAASFLGIPYATLTHRFAEPQVARNHATSDVDASKYGPTSPTPPGAFQLEMTMMQQNLVEPVTATSDLHALNLNITVPYVKDKLATTGKLPVFVWIHGGGFVSGSPSWPQYDMTNMVSLSAERNLPVIGVTVGFRLGALGFLTSRELRDAGCTTNNQLRDQIAALDWVREHIGGFGGDAENITLGGESAGAVEVGLLLQVERPLFARAFMSGGSSLLMPPSPPEMQEWIYSQVTEALGLAAASAEDRVCTLRDMPIDDLVTKVAALPLPYRPVVDDEIVKYAATYTMVSGNLPGADIAAKSWLKGLMVGDCQFDASSMAIFLAHKKSGIQEHFPRYLKEALKENEALLIDELLEAYGFTSSAQVDEEIGFRQYLTFLNDISYYAATVTFARGWTTAHHSNCHAFFVNEQNPWEGMFQGEATHIMDVMLLFQNLNKQFPPAVRANAVQFAVDCFTFMYGRQQQLWPSFSQRMQCVKVYGPSSWEPDADTPVAKVIDDILAPDSGRRRVMIDLGDRFGLDALAQAVAGFNAS